MRSLSPGRSSCSSTRSSRRRTVGWGDVRTILPLVGSALLLAAFALIEVPLAELDARQFSKRITAYTTSYFLTARLAARRMIPNESGVIMTVTTLQSRTGSPLVGGYGPAMAAKEALTRDLSAELAPQGIRVVGLRRAGPIRDG